MEEISENPINIGVFSSGCESLEGLSSGFNRRLIRFEKYSKIINHMDSFVPICNCHHNLAFLFASGFSNS